MERETAAEDSQRGQPLPLRARAKPFLAEIDISFLRNNKILGSLRPRRGLSKEMCQREGGSWGQRGIGEAQKFFKIF